MAVSPLRILIRRTFLHGSFVRKRYRCLSERLQVICQPLAIQASASPCYFYCTQVLFRNDVTVQYRDGLPVVSVPLPSRHESCEFTLKPVSHTVADFLQFITQEDRGIDRVAIYKEDGARVAGSTPIEILLRSNFKLVINDKEYVVTPPDIRPLLSEEAQTLSDVKHLVNVLYSTLHIEEYQLQRERDIMKRLEDLNTQIAPLEQIKQRIEVKASKTTNHLSWLGLGLMGLQFGILARLTWWEYSWDIMEPVTYFVTYGTSMAMFAYYLLTKQEYVFPDVRDREFLVRFYKLAYKERLNVDHYNRLRDAISKAEEDLRRLQDPLQLHLPIKEIQKRSESKQ
ncbi:calcium uniporter protein, mitochondrial-like [Pomacea canaliculata]|uniref:calcium uniporter protein, mitochondrial-like n=1 Tax=Pomacea canaliculata TaxID=400727 RepID=UPI000D7338D3|nr:calcium uniporter protein, mitochondrial-like [Pomacea canaliculata]